MSEFGREVVQIFEIDRVRCSLVFGESPCQGVLGVTGVHKCTNARANCHDPASFTPEIAVDRYLLDQEGTLEHYAPFVPSMEDMRVQRPLSINLAGMDKNSAALGTRETLSVKFRDHLHSGLGHDPYRLERYTGDASLHHSGTADPDSNTGEMTDFLVLAEDAPLEMPRDAVLRLVSGPGSTQQRSVLSHDPVSRVARVTPRWATNAFQHPTDFSDAYWSKANLAALTQDGAWWRLEDNSAAAWGLLSRAISTALTTDYVVSIRVRKEAASTGIAQLLRLGFSGGTTHSYGVVLDAFTGDVLEKDAGGANGFGLVDEGDAWRLWISGNSLDNTSLSVQFYPAVGPLPLSSGYNAAQLGVCHAKDFQLELGEEIGEFIDGGASAVSMPEGTTDYELREALDPYKRGTYWGKWQANNPFHSAYSCRAYWGYLGDPIESMRVGHYIVDRVEGPINGMVSLTAKDVFSKIEARKAVAPFASRGELSADLTGTPAGFTVNPPGIGDTPEEGGGYASISTDAAYLAIGDELVHVTRSGDDFTFVADSEGKSRGCLGTEAADHEADDLVQVVFAAVQELPHDIAYRLLTEFSKIDPSKIDKAAWDALAAEITDLYTGRVGKPTPVLELIGELMRQAGFTLWPNVSTGMIELRALRAGAVSPVVNDHGWIVNEPPISVKPEHQKRVSQVWVYYGMKNPLEDLDDDRNFHSRVLRPDVDVVLDLEGETKYDVPAIENVFSRWIPKGGRAPAERCGDRIAAMFQDPPLVATFRLNVARDGELDYARYFELETADVQDQTGQPRPVTMATIEIARGEFESSYRAQSVNFADVPEDDGVRRVVIENDDLNINLRTLHDSHYPAPVGDEVIEFILVEGFSVGSSSTAAYAVDTGEWPTMTTPPRLVIMAPDPGAGLPANGIQGCGGQGGHAQVIGGVYTTGPGQPGGPALKLRVPFTLSGNGRIWGGAGGGGSGGAGISPLALGGGGGGGMGINAGPGGVGYNSGSPGDENNGGVGGNGNVVSSGRGGQGGAVLSGLVGFTGQSGTGTPGASGGAAGVAIDGWSLVTLDTDADLDIRGATIG